MAITNRQKQLDVIKWNKSIELGQDACGSFDYCDKCDKSLENPCDKAYQKLHKKPTQKKAVKAKTPAKKVAKK